MIAFECFENSQKFHAVKRLPSAIATAKKSVGTELQNFDSRQGFLQYARTLNEIVEINPQDQSTVYQLEELCREFHEGQHRAEILRLEEIAEAERKRDYWIKRADKAAETLESLSQNHEAIPALVQRIAAAQKHAEKWGQNVAELKSR